MSQSFGQGGGKQGRNPDRPPGSGPPASGSETDFDELDPVYDPRLHISDEQAFDEFGGQTSPEPTNWKPRKPMSASGTWRKHKARPDHLESAVRIEPTKRMVALIFDSMAWYFVAMILTVLPFVNHFITLNSAWTFFLLLRDYFFQGRGIGKNVMGLQVVDAKTGEPCSLKQSVLRNIIILAPFAVLQLIGVILTFVRIQAVNEIVKTIVDVVGMIYLVIVLPVECYRAYTREDSRRLGDVWAGTTLVEAPMDFSSPFSK